MVWIASQTQKPRGWTTLARFRLKQPVFPGNHLWLDRFSHYECVSFKEKPVNLADIPCEPLLRNRCCRLSVCGFPGSKPQGLRSEPQVPEASELERVRECLACWFESLFLDLPISFRKNDEKPWNTEIFPPELWDKPSDQGGDFSGTSFRLSKEDTQKGYKAAGETAEIPRIWNRKGLNVEEVWIIYGATPNSWMVYFMENPIQMDD